MPCDRIISDTSLTRRWNLIRFSSAVRLASPSPLFTGLSSLRLPWLSSSSYGCERASAPPSLLPSFSSRRCPPASGLACNTARQLPAPLESGSFCFLESVQQCLVDAAAGRNRKLRQIDVLVDSPALARPMDILRLARCTVGFRPPSSNCDRNSGMLIAMRDL